jgi:hypothetical protein
MTISMCWQHRKLAIQIQFAMVVFQDNPTAQMVCYFKEQAAITVLLVITAEAEWSLDLVLLVTSAMALLTQTPILLVSNAPEAHTVEWE